MDVDTLKARQDSRKEREKGLTRTFQGFMKEFEEELTLFIQEAIEAEIGGLRAVGQDSDDGQLREVRFGLRDSAFVLTIPSLVHEREIDGPLACRAFIYYTDDLENTPLVDVTVFEVDGGV